ncbi:hypothetical protein [Streptomyces sp. NPDC001205]
MRRVVTATPSRSGPGAAPDAPALPVQRAAAAAGRRSLTAAPRAVRPSHHLDPVGVVRPPAQAPAPATAPSAVAHDGPSDVPASVSPADAGTPAPPVQRKPLVRRVSRVQSAAPDAAKRRPLIGAPLAPGTVPPPAPVQAPTPAAAPDPAPPVVQRAAAPAPAEPPTPLRKVRLPGPTPLQRAAVDGPPLASARPLTTRHQGADTPGRPASVPAAAPVPLTQVPSGDDSRPVVPLRRPADRPGTTRPSVQRAAEQGPAPVVPVRRSSPPPAPPTPAPAPAPQYSAPVQRQAVQRQADPPAAQRSTTPPAPAATSAQPAAAEAEQGPDIDALARRLVAPLSRLLRAELRGDRERIGRLRDR